MLIVIPLLVLAMSRAVQYAFETGRVQSVSMFVGALVLVVYAAGFLRQSAIHHGQPWQELEGVLQQNYHAGDPVIFDALYAQVPFDYFARHARFQPREMGFPLTIYDWWDEQDFKGWGGPVIMRSDLDQFVAKVSGLHAKTVWLVLDETYYYDPHNQLLAALSESGHPTEFRFSAERDASNLNQDSSLYLVRIDVN